jgi:hypothetical protein
MRESASGSRTPQGSDAFSPTAQLADFADDEAQWNNVIVKDDATARNAMSAPELRTGILVSQKSDESLWLCTDAAGPDWVKVGSSRASGTITPATGYTVQAASDITKENDVVVLVLDVIQNVGNFTSNTDIATLPAGFRPTGTVSVACAFANATTGWLRILSTGVVRIFFTGTASNTVYANATYRTS